MKTKQQVKPNSKIKIFVTLLSSALLLYSCAPQQIFNISSNPSRALVYIDGKDCGKTPYSSTVKFKHGKNKYDAKLVSDGYVDTLFYIQYRQSYDKRKTFKNYHFDLKRKDVVTIELISFEPIATSAGVKLSKVEERSLAYLETIERSPNVKSVQRVTENEDVHLQIGAPIMSPVANDLIYYIYTKDKKGNSYSNIWKRTIGKSGKTQITFGTKYDIFPIYSPNGDFIYFSSNRISDNPVIWKINATASGGITKITSTQSEDYEPSVSPTGNILAYTSNPPSATEPQIWTINSNGSLPTQLKEGQSPQISPDNKTILFVKLDKENIATRGTEQFYPKQIWTMTIDGTSPTQLTQNNTSNAEQPKWSPDGKWIAYTSDEGKDLSGINNNDIWIMHSDGSERTQLTTNGSWDDMPCWSYDGQWIYFRSNRGGNWNLWRFQPILK